MRDDFFMQSIKKSSRTCAVRDELCFHYTIDERLWRSKTVAYSTAPLKSSKQRLLYVAESTTETLQLSHDSLVRMLS